MPFAGGDWWTQNARPILKYRSGAVTADVEQDDVASCAVTCAALAAGAVAAANKMADGIVTSEKATAALRHRTIAFTVQAPSSSEAAGIAAVESTSAVLWRPRTAVNVLQVTGFTRALYENATCDMFVLYGNNGTCIGQISLKAVAGSTALATGTRTAGSAITQAALAAGTDVLLKHVTSTCSTPRPYEIVIDFESTG